MDHGNLSPRQCKILLCLTSLPKKLLRLHGLDNVTEFILYELCCDCCFNLRKAAYCVDNPDFDCCKGVAGFSYADYGTHPDDAWVDPEAFSERAKASSFNQKVRSVYRESVAENFDTAVDAIAQEIGIEHPRFVWWELKNGNRGILVFEQGDDDFDEIKDHLEHGLSLLGFCPIF